MRSIGLIFAAVIVATAWQTCSSNHLSKPIKDLPADILAEILSILVNGTVHMTGKCAEDEGVQVIYWLYTHNKPNTPTNIYDFSKIDTRYPIMVLIHGYVGYRDVDYIQTMKNAYVKTMPSNVIVVDWGKYANGLYTSAYCNVPIVARNVADFIKRMSAETKVPLKKLHIVGHSLGAQVAGETGRQLKGELGRITGLDPAGPLYQDIAKKDRLDASDAKFVDVIHTNQRQFGYKGNVGDIDYYPNCAYYQPGCLSSAISIKEILKLPLNIIVCSHQRSCEYFAESITRNDFPAHKCLGCGVGPICSPLPEIPIMPKLRMGQYTTSKQRYADYFVLTKAESPFGSNLTLSSSNFNAIAKEPESQESNQMGY